MISSKIKKDEEEGGVAGEWKYAAMVMDRFDHDADADDRADDFAVDHTDDHTDDHAEPHVNADGEWKYAAMVIIIPAFHDVLKTFTNIFKCTLSSV